MDPVSTGLLLAVVAFFGYIIVKLERRRKFQQAEPGVNPHETYTPETAPNSHPGSFGGGPDF
jgi:hypothetical protein